MREARAKQPRRRRGLAVDEAKLAAEAAKKASASRSSCRCRRRSRSSQARLRVSEPRRLTVSEASDADFDQMLHEEALACTKAAVARDGDPRCSPRRALRTPRGKRAKQARRAQEKRDGRCAAAIRHGTQGQGAPRPLGIDDEIDDRA